MSCQVFVFDAILMRNKYNIGMCVCYVRLNIPIFMYVPHSEISKRLITMSKYTLHQNHSLQEHFYLLVYCSTVPEDQHPGISLQ